MRWSNVFVIFRREVRDQIRDRRTLFMIFVLPILLYPLLGIGIIQLQVAFEQKPRTVVVVGPEHLPSEPPLLNDRRTGFDASLFESKEAGRLLVSVEPAQGRGSTPRSAARDPGARGRRGRHDPGRPPPAPRPDPVGADPDRLRQHQRAEPASPTSGSRT